jgi:FkbM family methyltransferase
VLASPQELLDQVMNPTRAFTRPEYLFRPRQIIVRFRRALVGRTGDAVVVRLPWGSLLRVRPNEVIGASIWYYGVFDLVVTEAITRLLDPSENALDIGANVGQMTTLMSRRSGAGGRVWAFEPHPELFDELSANCARNAAMPNSAAVTLHAVGLSDVEGDAFLQLGPEFAENRGTATVAEAPAPQAAGLVPIRLRTVDSILPKDATVGLCKIDVEGHELRVLKGAGALLERRGVRDIIYEDREAGSAVLQRFFHERGFTVFSLHDPLWGPELRSPSEPCRGGENYLATLDAERAISRFGPRGWRALRG